MIFLGNGGGGGGRVAIHLLNENYHFTGVSQALGGSGYDHGPPGTTYVQSTLGTEIHRQLRLNNQNRGTENACNFPTELDESGDSYHFDLVELTNRACLRINSVSILVVISLSK